MDDAGIDRGRAVYVQRASQLESERLDDEVLILLLHQAYSALRYFPNRSGESFSPELRLILSGLLYANTVLVHVPSPGRIIQNLHLSSVRGFGLESRKNWLGNQCVPLSLQQRFSLLILDIILPYLWNRSQLWTMSSMNNRTMGRWLDYILSPLRRRRLWIGMGTCETVARALQVANFMAFLTTGRYPRLSHRLTGTTMQYTDIAATRTISFEFVNRQLVFSGFAEFMVFITPVIWSARTSRLMHRALSRLNIFGDESQRLRRGNMRSSVPWQQNSENADMRSMSCSHCDVQPPCMAHMALPCRHMYCYVCLAVAVEANPGYKCKRCGVSVHTLKRVVGV